MKTIIKKIIKVSLFLFVFSIFSCKKLTDVNINPNGTTPEKVNPSFLMTGVLTGTAKNYLQIGFDEPFPGVMQQTQKDAFSSGNNDYDWSDQSWDFYYGLLRNNKIAYDRAEAEGNNFIMGVSLTMKSFIFGLITDLWGDAPYSKALNGNKGGTENLLPEYDAQKDIYTGIISDLKTANGLLEKGNSGARSWDVYYNGDAGKWQKFTNSLLLRYYMRISAKLPDIAKTGVEEVVASGIYFKSTDDDATMDFIGNNGDNSWPDNLKFDGTNGSNFRRIKMGAPFVNTLQSYNDPRLDVWAAKVEIPIVISATFNPAPDIIINGVRYIHPDAIPSGTLVDTDPNYVGIPPSIGSEPSFYNLNPTPGQLSNNPHVSFLNDIYKEASGPLLKARLQSVAEVDFILAEAASKGWSVGMDAKTYYEDAVKASMDTWGVGSDYSNYINEPLVKFDGTLKQIMTQKWIASWTASAEAWFDYRRTGYPDLKAGPFAKQKKLPVRFVYSSEELNLNATNVEKALKDLEVTNFSGPQGANSQWSKPWVIQGTSQPW
ncbi:MAG: SusD/RagB family nutrient-binding outer membrane lipoprotein [Ginsengibacter sp.]